MFAVNQSLLLLEGQFVFVYLKLLLYDNFYFHISSRNTSIKVWCYKNLKNIKLIHSFGGHTGSVTQVKFWNMDYYEESLNNLALQTGEPIDQIDDESDLGFI